MKALVHTTLVFDVEDEEEIEWIALAMRQKMYLDLVELCEQKGYDPTTFEAYAPTVSFPLDLTEAM